MLAVPAATAVTVPAALTLAMLLALLLHVIGSPVITSPDVSFTVAVAVAVPPTVSAPVDIVTDTELRTRVPPLDDVTVIGVPEDFPPLAAETSASPAVTPVV